MDSCQPEVYLGGLYVSRNRKILLRYNYTHLYSNLTLRISSSLTNNVFLFIHASFQENASLGTNFLHCRHQGDKELFAPFYDSH